MRLGTVIFHIVKRSEWQEAVQRGTYEPESLASEGFIHCSTTTQTLETANRFFQSQQDLVLLVINEERLAAECRWETPANTSDERRGELFPHVYGPLNLDAVIQAVDFPCEADQSFHWPPALHQ
ncbi:MAG TPA: DUF952 domain-containing protein [Bryobacteraceae bacterium]|jgi:uncharacterized protein (DUF952 family)|nr:DUF952 domain-containing protein [Bryobacteraceae bacterium]